MQIKYCSATSLFFFLVFFFCFRFFFFFVWVTFLEIRVLYHDIRTKIIAVISYQDQLKELLWNLWNVLIMFKNYCVGLLRLGKESVISHTQWQKVHLLKKSLWLPKNSRRNPIFKGHFLGWPSRVEWNQNRIFLYTYTHHTQTELTCWNQLELGS